MQGRKIYQEKLYTSFQLSDRVPRDNFYRRLKDAVNLDYLFKETVKFYGDCGQKSIDPVVFFKLCLVGYLENITSDRKLIEHSRMRLDILFFLGYDIDEELPWHSTMSRTRQLFPDTIFEKVFTKVLQLCIDKGMVSGHTQAIDSALIKANASMDSIELKVPAETLEDHLKKVRHLSRADRPAKKDKSNKEQKTITTGKRKLKEIETRQKKWAKDQDQRPGAGNKGSKYTSNATHYSPTDPDARISVKPGKARKLNYFGQMAVDIANHVITHIGADFADKKDSQCLQTIVEKLKTRLNSNSLLWTNLLADAGYSSGENYAYLEQKGITAYIPPHGTYKGGPEGFTYHKDGDYWVCDQGKKVTYRKSKIEKGTLKKYYFTRRKDCSGCPLKTACIGKSFEKRISITAYKEEYDRAIKRIRSRYGKQQKNKRLSTVEPVFGTLINFMGLQKINTIGIKQANKAMIMAGTAYNLKKYLNYIGKITHNMVKSGESPVYYLYLILRAIFRSSEPRKILPEIILLH
jgi:transposase